MMAHLMGHFWDELHTEMINKTELPQKFIDILINLPEQGMGYQIVDIFLENGSVLRNRKVVNSTFLLLNENEQLEISKIEKIELSED